MRRSFIILFFFFSFITDSYGQELLKEFEPNKISNGNVFRGSFSPDGHTFYFFKKHTAGEEDYRIYVSKKKNDTWTDPQKLIIGKTEENDLYPAISPDGKMMVFTSYRPVNGAIPALAQLWYSLKDASGKWKEPVYMQDISLPGYYESNPVFVGDRDIVFRRISPDWQTKETYVARWNGAAYDSPVLYEPVMRWNKWDEGIRIDGGYPSADETLVILTVKTRDEASGHWLSADQYYTQRLNGIWTIPKPLGSGLNSNNSDENFVFFDPGMKNVYIVRQLERIFYTPLSDALK